MIEYPTKEQYLKKIQEIRKKEINSDRFKFVKSFIEQYKKRGALDKEQELLLLIGNYNDSHIDEINNGYLYTKEKKINQYKQLSDFLNSLTEEEIKSNLYLKISKYLFDNSNSDCGYLLKKLDKFINQSCTNNKNNNISYEIDIPKERLDILHERISLEAAIPYYKPESYKIDYVSILDDENIKYYQIYNKIINVVRKICNDIYMLQLWNVLLEYDDQVELTHFSSIINSEEKIFTLSFYLIK